MASTVYDIKVRYLLDDKASKGLAGIAKQAQKSAKQTSALDSTLRKLAFGAAGFLSFRLAKKLLIDYNDQIQQAKTQMGGLLQMNMGGDWARNQKRANWLVSKFQQDAKASTGTTKDFVDMGAMLTGPLSRAGASMENIASVTKGAVIASRAFGVEASMAALDIGQALSGTLASKDRFARALLEPLGYTTEKWNAMVKKTPELAAKALMDALNQPAILNMAKEQENSWAGVTSTLEDNLQIAFGKVGLPLMQKITAEVAKMNEWFNKNPQKLAAIVDGVAGGLVTAFQTAQKIFGYIIENKELLLTLAKAYLVSRAAGGLASAFGGSGNIIGQIGTALGGLLGGKEGGGLVGFGNKLGVAAGALGAFAVGAQAVADHVLAAQDRRISRTTDNPFLREQARLLGGASAGSGTGIASAVVRGTEADARRLGYRSDAGAFEASMLGTKTAGIDAEGRRTALGRKQFTAGDKLMASNEMRDAKGAGFLDGSGGMSGRAAMKLAGNFGVPDQGAAGRMFSATLANSLGAGKTVEETLAIVESLNKQYGTEQSARLEEFVRGLTVANALDHQSRMEQLRAQSADIQAAWSDLMERNNGSITDSLKSVASMLWEKLANPAKATEGGDIAKDRAALKRPSTNVKIGKIEVISDDPDRFAFNLVGAFQDYVKSPTQAARAIREG